MNVVDSSGWLEFFANGPNAGFFAEAIEDVDHLVVPAPCLYEVFRCVMRQWGEGPALQAAAVMQQGRVVDVDASLTLDAAHLSVRSHLSQASSLVVAVARQLDATVWTQETELAQIEGVRNPFDREVVSAR
jgi:predicted nucleic acid-binding protein